MTVSATAVRAAAGAAAALGGGDHVEERARVEGGT